MEPYILYIFIMNIVLVLCDVSLGYHLAPLLGRSWTEDEEDAWRTTRRMRKLLSAVVALYTLLNCFAYSKESPAFLFIVTAVVLLDMIGQFFLNRKLRNNYCD
jgi:hypothetical protein